MVEQTVYPQLWINKPVSSTRGWKKWAKKLNVMYGWPLIWLMVGQTPFKQKNVSRLVTIVFTRQGNTILDKLLFPWLDFFFLDLRSEGLSSLASLGRQLSFFPTISEKKVQSRKEKFVLNCIPCLVTLCHQQGIYIPYEGRYMVKEMPKTPLRN